MINLEEFLDRKEFKIRGQLNEQDCKMDQLPNELVFKIFLDYLNWNDHSKLSKVCKRFYFILQNKRRIKELAIFLDGFPFAEQLYFTGHSIDYSNTVCLPSITCMFAEVFQNKFQDIEYLLIVNNLIDDLSQCKIDFNDRILNYFDKLKHVELRSITHIKGKLDLPLLETLYISTRLQSDYTILSPNLLKLACFGHARSTLVHSKSLTTIAARTLVQPFIGYGFLNKRSDCSKLTSLITFEANQIKWMIQKFQNQLKQVTCIGQLKIREINDIIKMVNDLKLFELNLYYFGLNVQNEAVKQILNSEHDESIFSIENLNSQFVAIFSRSLIDFQQSIPYIQEISLDDVGQISDEFISKLTNLQVLTLQSSKRETRLNSSILLKFMNSSKKLIKLNLESIEIEQVHMDLMPDHFQLLNELQIKDCKIYDLDFVNRFKHLHSFTTNCDLNIRQTTKLLLESCPVRIIFC